jgi:hypothetical protein
VRLVLTGHQATAADGGGWLVPKKQLISTLQVLLAARRLQVAPTLAEAPTLVRELLQFQVKVTRAALETFGSGRDSQHDDSVLAVALAVWYAERCPVRASFAPHVLSINSARRQHRQPKHPSHPLPCLGVSPGPGRTNIAGALRGDLSPARDLLAKPGIMSL